MDTLRSKQNRRYVTLEKIQEVYFGLESFEPYIPLDICSNTYSAVENFKTL